MTKLENELKENNLVNGYDLSILDIDMFEKLYYDPEKELDSEEDYDL